jgi:hypothetical protein
VRVLPVRPATFIQGQQDGAGPRASWTAKRYLRWPLFVRSSAMCFLRDERSTRSHAA